MMVLTGVKLDRKCRYYHRATMIRCAIVASSLLSAQQAIAQNTTNNAVTQSEDAFGRAVGNERIGIYSNEEVRGFNPSEAGNSRLEGLYFDQGGGLVPPRLVTGSTIRVGYAARTTAFPAPTGIVDTRIEKFSGTRDFSAELELEDYANVAGTVKAKLPVIGSELGLALGAGFREADQIGGRNGRFRNWLVGASWLPAKGSEITLFNAGFRGNSAEPTPTFFPSGAAPPPLQPRKLQQAQPWAENVNGASVSGLIFKMPLGRLGLEAGLFRTVRTDTSIFLNLFQNVTPGGAANLVVLADGNNRTASTSGEVRLSRTWTGENLRHALIASVRGRNQNRLFGGQQRIALGTVQTGIQDFRPEPVITLGPDDQSHVRQMIAGLQYSLQTTSGGTFNVAVQKATYRKDTDFVDPARSDVQTRDAPWLYSVNGSIAILPGLIFYGGYVRGMEESALAPDIATNRNDSPPALLTRQMDAGLRYALTPQFSVIVGVFDIQKPFFGLDGRNLFTNLGTVSNRGVEISLTGTVAKGLTVVAGGILVNPKVTGPAVIAREIAQRPLGTFKQRGIVNLDWKPAGQQAWSFDLAFEHVSGELAAVRLPNGATTTLVPFETAGRTTLNIGARYRFNLGKTSVLLRGQILNVFNNYAWRVSSSGGFTFTMPPVALLNVIIDI